MGKIVGLVIFAAIVGVVLIVVTAMIVGHNTGIATAGIAALASLFTGAAGVGGTYMMMKRKQGG